MGLGGIAESRTSAFARGVVVERHRKLEMMVSGELNGQRDGGVIPLTSTWGTPKA